MNIYRTKFCLCNQNRGSLSLSPILCSSAGIWSAKYYLYMSNEKLQFELHVLPTHCHWYCSTKSQSSVRFSVQQPWNHVKTTLRMHYNMLSDNGSENTTHWNIFWTLTHVTIVITITGLLLLSPMPKPSLLASPPPLPLLLIPLPIWNFPIRKCACILYLCKCVSQHLALYCSLAFYIPLSPRLIYSSIQLYLQPNQTVNCRKQGNFTINHCRTQSLLFEIHWNNKLLKWLQQWSVSWESASHQCCISPQ